MGKNGEPVWIQTVIFRIFILLFLFQIIVFFFFVLGNFQNFADSTQLLLISVLKLSGIFFILFSVYNLFIQLFSGFTGRSFRAGRFIFSLTGFVIGAALVVLVYFFNAILTPVAVQ